MQGKKSDYQIIGCDAIEKARLSIVCVLYGLEEVIGVVGLSKVVLDVIVFGGDSQLDKLILESSALLKEAVYFTFYLHILQ